MKTIAADIKKNEFKPLYLLYGDEDYLKLQIRNSLKEAIVGDNAMSLTVFTEKPSPEEIISIGETMPFMSEYRLMIFDRCDFFKLKVDKDNKNDKLLMFFKHIPDYLKIVIIESTVDKRLQLYKAVSTAGYTCEINTQSEASGVTFIQDKCKKENKVIDRSAAAAVFTGCGGDFGMISCELEKLYSYTLGREEITAGDVKNICSVTIEERVFDMIAAIASKNARKALDLYYDLVAVREPPAKILILMARQFSGLYQAKSAPKGMPAGEIAKTIGLKGVAPFVAGRYLKQAGSYTLERLRELVEGFAQAEEDVKTGRMSDKTALELMIAECLR